MIFRFFRRLKILPGVTINVSKSGPSVSLGPRGAKVTVGLRGMRYTAGIPGTGIFWTEEHRRRAASGGTSKSISTRPTTPEALAAALIPSFFQKLTLTHTEIVIREVLSDLIQGKYSEVLEKTNISSFQEEPDFCLLRAYALIMSGSEQNAISFLRTAANSNITGRSIYSIPELVTLTLGVWFCDRSVEARFHLDRDGARLLLAHALSSAGKHEECLNVLSELHNEQPENGVIALWLAENIIERDNVSKEDFEEVLAATEPALENENAIETGLLFWRARCFRKLGLPEMAYETLNLALRKKSKRPEMLLLNLQYERALSLLELGKPKKAEQEFVKILARKPDYKDVKQRVANL